MLVDNINGISLPTGLVLPWKLTSGVYDDYFDGTGLGIGNLDGWALCNGNNGTDDLQGQHLSGWSESEPAGTTYTQSTALPVNGFTTDSKTVTPSGSITVNDGYATGDAYEYVPHASSYWETDEGSNVEGSGDYYPKQNSGSIYSTNLEHDHSASFSGSNLEVGNQTISGGDTYTRPAGITTYFIMKL